MEDRGTELFEDSPENTHIPTPRAAESGARAAREGQFPDDLLTIIEAWPALTEGTRSQLVNLVRSLIDPSPESKADPIAETAVVVRCE